MEAGPLRNRIEIQAERLEPDGGGGYVKRWGTIPNGRRWARRIVKGARERWLHGQVQKFVGEVFEVRTFDGPTHDMRVLWGSLVYRIAGVHDATDRQGDGLMLVCELVSSDRIEDEPEPGDGT